MKLKTIQHISFPCGYYQTKTSILNIFGGLAKIEIQDMKLKTCPIHGDKCKATK